MPSGNPHEVILEELLQRGVKKLKADNAGVLQSPNLDNRTWAGLVSDCRKELSKSPTWKDLSPADPGITLIETFAFLIEQLIYRVNRVPGKMYAEFLKLMGVRRIRKSPASTDLVFKVHVTADMHTAIPLPKGEQVATIPTATEQMVVFETDRPVDLAPANLVDIRIFSHHDNSPEPPEPPASHLTRCFSAGSTVAEDLADSVPAAVPLMLEHEKKELWLGFDGAITSPFSITFQVAPRNNDTGDLVWRYWQGGRSEPIQVEPEKDLTHGLSQSGRVTFQIPNGSWKPVEMEPANPISSRMPIYWLSVVGIQGLPDQAAPKVEVAIEKILFNHVPATAALTSNVKAKPAFTHQEEPDKGRSYAVFQMPETATPLYTSEGSPVKLTFLVEGRDEITFDEEGDAESQSSGQLLSSDRNQRLDLAAGVAVLSWGDTIEDADKGVVNAKYRYVAHGSESNVPAGSIVQPSINSQPARDRVASVFNPFAASGGRDLESIERATARGRNHFRVRDRAITRSDFEYLLLTNYPNEVKRAKCLAAGDAGFPTTGEAGSSRVQIYVFPGTATRSLSADSLRNWQPLTLSEDGKLTKFVQERSLIGLQPSVRGANVTPLDVNVSLTSKVADALRTTAIMRNLESKLQPPIDKFLHPLTGGFNREGWPLEELDFRGMELPISLLINEYFARNEPAYLGHFKVDIKPAEKRANHIGSTNGGAEPATDAMPPDTTTEDAAAATGQPNAKPVVPCAGTIKVTLL